MPFRERAAAWCAWERVRSGWWADRKGESRQEEKRGLQEGARDKNWEEGQREGSLNQEGGSQSQVSTELLLLLLFFV